ncbi:SusC/RagA family TonB-linked outer membrane protein [Chitinophaga rhizosphaerae]|uniref:SusC/RagA family TonB-linked outer membrane protein n=1 Tax=Chitinophaga rhizosphaerae TaxID=1864947 RepID=UPI000F80FCB4|nr:SusC/RagA family TonB-linked outer membrane protein [Chitinophaga rhizosphaerae]
MMHMRDKIRLTMLSLFVLISQSAVAQQQRSQPLSGILKEVGKTYNVRFAYEFSILENKSSTFDLAAHRQLPLDELLKQLLYPQKLVFIYVKRGHYAIVPDNRREPAAPAGKTQPAEPASYDVSGTVTGDGGAPVVGATISVPGTTLGAVTDDDGQFRLRLPMPVAKLHVSCLGYLPQDVLPGYRDRIAIVLQSNVKMLEQVEVSTGYQTLPKDRQTGAFGQLTAKDLQQKPVPNIIDRLEGMVSGVLVDVRNTDAMLSASGSSRIGMSIRGRNTISNPSTSPLVVIDGFSTELDLRAINPDDIERITFLKDAAAASIWGVRAANGVVVIETRKGSYHKAPIVNLSTVLSVAGRPRLSYRPILNSTEYLDFEQEMIDKKQLTDPLSQRNPFMISEGMEIMFQQLRGKITPAEKEAALAQLRARDYSDQYQKYFLQNPANQQYNLSVSGGENAIRYFLSSSYAKELPIAKGNSADRWTVNLQTTAKFLKRFTLTAGLNAASVKQENNGYGLSPLTPGSGTVLPYARFVDANGQPVRESRAFYYSKLDELESKGYLPWRFSYLDEMANMDNVTRDHTYRFNGALDIDLIKGLKATIMGMQEKGFVKTRNYYNEASYTVRNTINNATSIQAGTGKLVYGIPKGAILNQQDNELSHYNLRGQLTLNRTFGTRHRVDAVAGSEIRQYLMTTFSDRKYGFNDQDLTFQAVNYDLEYFTAVYSNRTKVAVPSTLTYDRNRYLSYYGNASYTYVGKYTLSGSARLDDSNLFGASRKYRSTPLWSAGMAWRVSEEAWMKNNWLDKLQLRATYGLNGNVDRSTSPYLIANVLRDNINDLSYATIRNPENPYLRWEKTATLNIGTDFAMWDGKFGGSVDVYFKKNTDLLGPATLNPTLGFGTATINTAAMKGRGVDVTLFGTLIAQRNWGWNTMLTFAWNKNEVTSADRQLDNVSYYLSGQAIRGKPMNYLYSYRFGGLDNEGQPLIYDDKHALVNTTVTVTNPAALAYSGVTVPPYFGGWTNTFHWKGLELSSLITYKLGHVFRRTSAGNYSNYISQKILHADVSERWKKPGDEQFTDVPGIPVFNGRNNPARYLSSDKLIESGSHARLREVTLSYNVPVPAYVKNVLRTLQVSVQGRNLALWTKNKQGIDPDFIPSDNATVLPPAKSFIFSLRAGF